MGTRYTTRLLRRAATRPQSAIYSGPWAPLQLQPCRTRRIGVLPLSRMLSSRPWEYSLPHHAGQQHQVLQRACTKVGGPRLFSSNTQGPPPAPISSDAEDTKADSSRDKALQAEDTSTEKELPPLKAGIPGVRYAEQTMAIVFTCKKCETRAAKAFSKQAYDHGVVIVRCPGCDNLHLVADRLGWFDDQSWDVQKALSEMGDKVVAVNDDNILQLTPKDILGSPEEPPLDGVVGATGGAGGGGKAGTHKE